MPDNIVTVAIFCTSEEAHLARNSLLAADIEAFILDENIVALDFRLGPAVGGVKLNVHKDDAKRAITILNEGAKQAKHTEKTVLSDEEMAIRAYRSLALGLIFPPLLLYSIWIACRLLLYSRSLSERTRMRLIITGAINLFIAFIITVFIIVLTHSRV